MTEDNVDTGTEDQRTCPVSVIMDRPRADGTRCRSADATGGLTTEPARRQERSGDAADAAESQRDLPGWMRLYLYGMHGVTLDVLLSSLRGVVNHRDPKLLGFSSVYLCVSHALTHFVLEKIYGQKRCFKGRPVVFHLVFYPSIYIGLQILIGNINTLTEQVRVVSGTQLLLHYILALYFSQVFHKRLARLQYDPSICLTHPLTKHGQENRGSVLSGLARFLFFGMHGLLDEIFFTSVFNLVEKSDRTLSGHTSLWSFLMYGSCSFVVDSLYQHLHFQRGWGTWSRLPLYVCIIYTWEFTWGLVLRQFDACSWDYSHYPYNFMGLITLVYLPGWIGLSLYQDVLSNVLLRIRSTKDTDDSGWEKDEWVNGKMESKKH